MHDAGEGAGENADNSQKTAKDYTSVGDMTGKTKVNLGINIPRNPDQSATEELILTLQTIPNTNGIGEHTLDKVYAGQEIRFVGNAASSEN